MKQHLQRVWFFAWNSPALRQSAVLMFGTVITGVLMAGAMIVASRALGPEKFGTFSVSIAIMSLLSKGVDLGLNQLIPRLLNKWHTKPELSQEFLAQTVLWKIRLVFITLAVSVVSIPFIVSFLRYPHLDMIGWSIVGALIIGFYEYVYLLLAAKHMFFLSSVMSVLQAVLKATGFVFILLFARGSLNGVAAMYYLAPLIGAGTIAWQVRDWMWVKPAMAGDQVRSEMQVFLQHAFVGVIAMTLITNLDVLLVQRSLTSFETGLYAGATRIAALIAFATNSIGGVLNNRVSRYTDKATLRRYLLKSLSLIVVAVLGFVVYLPLARYSLIWTIGPEYLPGLPTLIVLVLNAFLSLAVVPFISFFYAVDHPRYFSVGGILQVLVILIGNWLFLPVYGIQAAAWTKVIATLAFAVYTCVYVLYAWQKLPKLLPSSQSEANRVH